MVGSVWFPGPPVNGDYAVHTAIEDVGGYYISQDVEGALQEIGQAVGSGGGGGGGGGGTNYSGLLATSKALSVFVGSVGNNITATQIPTGTTPIVPASFFLLGSDYGVPGSQWEIYAGGFSSLFIGSVAWPGPAPFTWPANTVVFNQAGGLRAGTLLFPSNKDLFTGADLSPNLYSDGTVIRTVEAFTFTTTQMPARYFIA